MKFNNMNIVIILVSLLIFSTIIGPDLESTVTEGFEGEDKFKYGLCEEWLEVSPDLCKDKFLYDQCTKNCDEKGEKPNSGKGGGGKHGGGGSGKHGGGGGGGSNKDDEGKHGGAHRGNGHRGKGSGRSSGRGGRGGNNKGPNVDPDYDYDYDYDYHKNGKGKGKGNGGKYQDDSSDSESSSDSDSDSECYGKGKGKGKGNGGYYPDGGSYENDNDDSCNDYQYKRNSTFHDQPSYIVNPSRYNVNRRRGKGKGSILPDERDQYILKSQIVPPVCPACPSNNCNQKPPAPCPPCGRCPESLFDCGKVPNFGKDSLHLPPPKGFLNSFAAFR